jgi:cellobiose PTS system EIIC component
MVNENTEVAKNNNTWEEHMNHSKTFIEQKIIPKMTKINDNKAIKSLTGAMMASMPLTLGTSLVAIIANFPITVWTTFLTEKGITAHATALIGGTSQILALFLAFLVAYHYANLKGHDGITAGVMSLGAFFVLMPQTYEIAEGQSINVFQKTYMGSSGVFVALILGLVVAGCYSFLKSKGLIIKLPESMPEMISKSLSPTFIAMIIFTGVFAIRIVFGFTESGNIFDFVNTTLAKPLMNVGSSPIALILIYALGNVFWWFGIHPSALLGFYIPVFMTAFTSNIEAFQAGTPLPYLGFIVAYTFIMAGGTGCTLGLAINMAFFSKSERFKAMGKLGLIPNIFNINEPIIFGTPIIFNPIFLAPMALAPILMGGIALVAVNVGFYDGLNPLIRMPWTMPAPITHLLQSGPMAAITITVAILVSALLYFPFFKVADMMALKEEQVTQE